LGLCLGLALWLRSAQGAPGEVSLLALSLHWLTPLLLVAGLALVLSLRLPAALASGVAYACWLAGLGLFYSVASPLADVGAYSRATLPIGIEIAIGVAGIALLSLGPLRFPNSVPRMLPGV